MKVDPSSRQFERQDVSLDARLHVAQASAEQLCFSGAAPTAQSPSTIEVTVVDLGYGGVGLKTYLFLPRLAAAEIEILMPQPDHDASIDPRSMGDRPVLFRHPVRVRRCQMTSRIPTYLVGAAFESAGPDLRITINKLMEELAQTIQRIASGRLAASEGERGA